MDILLALGYIFGIAGGILYAVAQVLNLMMTFGTKRSK